VKATSDDFFARPDALAHFPEGVADFTFIDGMHLFEYAFRDFINAERFSTPGSVIVLDDMLPRRVSEAARDRHTSAWAGDVYKVATVLETYRPDLAVLPINTAPTGVVVVVGLDPSSTVLTEHYQEILDKHVVPDPQPVPDEVYARSTAAEPELLLDADIWEALIAARSAEAAPSAVTATVRGLRGTATYTAAADARVPSKPSWPPRPAATQRPAKKAAAKKAAPGKRGPARRGRIHRLRKAIKRRL
jgi:pyruvate/2-oxoglutarate dehydrogenase complex dihydrolipoamide acyltransferase (E2) component